ncbi:MAG: copper amine oxidase N-terminal domain-containing protein [Peptoniphilus sp.]|nr:copper amine oxidase N-terminal domain-containing protein [Peptoniphilus sp.]MDY6045134.1 copper amine oxidase N-terminal domain-containing protein [Peptoniphilus sp.]
MKRRSLLLALFLVFLCQIPASAHYFEDPVYLWMDGRYLYSDAAPYIKQSRTMVPLRVISENFGYDVSWDGNTRTVTIRKDSASPAVSLVIGEKVIFGSESFAGRPVFMDSAAEIKDDRTFVPLRAVAELFGHPVDWDGNARTAVIGTGYTSPYVRPFNPRMISLTFDGVKHGDVYGFAYRDGRLFVDFTDLAHSLNLKTNVEQGIFSGDDPDDLCITLTEPNGRSLTFDGRYITSSDGLNFGEADTYHYLIVDGRIFVSLEAYADFNHLKLTFENNTVSLTTDTRRDIYPIQFSVYPNDLNGPTTYHENPIFAVYWNGSRYVLSSLSPDGSVDSELNLATYMDYIYTDEFDEFLRETPEKYHRYFDFGYNNHFLLTLRGHLVSGFMAD